MPKLYSVQTVFRRRKTTEHAFEQPLQRIRVNSKEEGKLEMINEVNEIKFNIKISQISKGIYWSDHAVR